MTEHRHCPECSGPIWDNREGKRLGLRPSSPDFRCRNPSCGWQEWPSRTPGGPGRTLPKVPASSARPRPVQPLCCPTCGETWGEHSVWVWRPAPDGSGSVASPGVRILVRHRKDRPCARFNGPIPWADGPPPEPRQVAPAHPRETAQRQRRDALLAGFTTPTRELKP